MQSFIDFFSSENFMPHGHCFLWQSNILWLHVLSDAAIAFAYFSIPFVLLYFVKKRKDLPFSTVFLLFGAFILLCGSTHLLSIWVLWHPDYAFEGIIKALTAIVSVSTLFVTIKLIPQALLLASPEQLGKMNEKLWNANRKLEVLYKQSRESGKARLSAVVDNVVDGIITINERGIVESFNPACERIFGYAAQEVVGKNIKILMPEPYHSEHDGYLDNYHKSGVAKIIGIGREVSGKRKDGSIFPMDLSISTFRLEDKRHFSGIIRDISDRKEAEKLHEQLRQAQKMEALGQLTGGIAHDFNNLLAVILGNLDFIAERVKKDDALQEFIRPGIEAAEHGAALTQQLLAFGRKQALQPKVISINQLLNDFVALVRRTLGEHIEIIVSSDPDLWHVRIDPSQLQSALLNLAVNARDAMPAGGKLIFETRNIILDELYAANNADVVSGEYVMVAVSDTGEGMTLEVMQKAFEPFFTTKDLGKGSGLGLSMVYGFVKQSGGHIKLYSEPGHGTSVKIYLPRAEGDLSASAERIEERVVSGEKKMQLVLVVEDNKNVLKLTSSMIESLGYSVMVAETGEAAMDIFKSHPDIDLLVTDVMLPGAINGPILAKRAVALYPKLKVLFNSGYAEHAILQSGLLDGGVHLIGKPFRKQQLAQKIQEVLK